MQCPQCQHENAPDAKFCNECGTPQALRCSACGTENPPGSKFCKGCGASFTVSASAPAQSQQQSAAAPQREPASCTPQYLAEKILTSRSVLEGERKQVDVAYESLLTNRRQMLHGVEQAIQYRSRQVQCWFKTFLSEVYCADGQIEKAYDVARQALKLAEDIKHPYGIGLAKHALGHITYITDNLAEAATSLHEALAIFDAIEAQYYLARTHLDLASLAHTQGNHDTATTHLSTAHAWFKRLQVPERVEKTEELAQEYGVTLTDDS